MLPTALVRGAGPTGALAALALADAGWQVQLEDPLTADQLTRRTRAYAFTHSSRRLLEQLGLWSALEPQMAPFDSLQLADTGCGAGPVTFTPADLGAGGCGPVGWIGQHGPLVRELLQRLNAHPAIALRLGGGNGSSRSIEVANQPRFDLVVAADGPHSPSREALGVGVWQWSYPQSCLTAQVQLRSCGETEAWELFRPEGPMALLPLGEGWVQVVWSAQAERCRQLQSLSPDAFLDQLAGALPDRFQPDALAVEPQAFPVGLALARRLHRGHTVLVGESAHRCHPVGGQGLNLCWRDVALLHRLAGQVSQGRLAAAALPRRYGRRRWADLLITLTTTDLLVRLFSNRSPLLLPLRRLALAALQHSAGLRRLSLGVMTHGPCRLGRW
jgi:2-octaprenyl-6-methoxyphenol hydroxylase